MLSLLVMMGFGAELPLELPLELAGGLLFGLAAGLPLMMGP